MKTPLRAALVAAARRDARVCERRSSPPTPGRLPSGTTRWCSPTQDDDHPRHRSAGDGPDRRRQHLLRHRIRPQPSRLSARDRQRRGDCLRARRRTDAAAERRGRYTEDPAKHTARRSAPGDEPAVWIMNLSVAGQTLAVPMYVNPTVGPEQALGGYKLSICLPPPDVPVGTPGRAFQGAQLLDAQLTRRRRLHDADERRPRQVGDPVHAVQPRQGHAERRGHVRGARVRAAADRSSASTPRTRRRRTRGS